MSKFLIDANSVVYLIFRNSMFMNTIFRTTIEWFNIMRIIILIERLRSSRGRVAPAKKPGSTLHSF